MMHHESLSCSFSGTIGFEVEATAGYEDDTREKPYGNESVAILAQVQLSSIWLVLVIFTGLIITAVI